MRDNDEQRNDEKLNAMVLAELVKHREDLVSAIAHMSAAYNILRQTDDLKSDVFTSSHHERAMSSLNSDINRMEWFVKHILDGIEEATASGRSAYVSNTAAFLDENQVERLRRKYDGTY